VEITILTENGSRLIVYVNAKLVVMAEQPVKGETKEWIVRLHFVGGKVVDAVTKTKKTGIQLINEVFFYLDR
jgi:hypothetical protein